MSHLVNLEKSGYTPKDMKMEIALKTRAETIAKSYEIAKELYGIMNQVEEVEYKKLAEYEKYKKELLGEEGKDESENNSDIRSKKYVVKS